MGRNPVTILHVAWLRIAAALALCVLAILVAPASVFAADSLKGVALVIGNGDYEHLSKLANPENDANDVEQLLSKLGFETTATNDRDSRRLRRDLEGFAEDAEGADVAVLYYSGHGIEAGGRNFLVPVDADLSSLDNAGESLVPIDALIDKLKSEVPIVIVMLDACRDNPFPADAVVKLSPDAKPEPISVSGLGASRSAVSLNPTVRTAMSDPNVGTVLAFAAEPGKVALDGNPGENSPYAAALLRHLSAMAGDEFGMVMRMVAEEVYLKTGGQQRPWVNESMRRLLYLGKTPDQPTGAEGDILTERRGLLVTIAALPDPQRRTVETIATDAGVPMDALYGMMSALGSEIPSDPKELDTLLRSQTDKVKAMIAERDTLKSADPEIMRLSALADEALAEGALNTAIDLRQQAKARAEEVEATVEDAEAQLKQRRVELAEVYAKSAESYALAFKHREAASDYEEAARQVEKWDDEKTFWYLRAASTAYLDAGKLRGGARDLEKSVDNGKQAASMAERLLADNPDDRDYWQDISAQTLNNLANAASALFGANKSVDSLNDSIVAYEKSLTVLSRERVPMDWVVVQHNLAGSLMILGENKNDPDLIRRAIAAYQDALTVWTPDSDAQKWAIGISGRGGAQNILGRMTNDKAVIEESIASLKAALTVQTQENATLDWAWTQRQLGDSYAELARLTHEQGDIDRSMAASQEALKVYTLDKAPRTWAQTMTDMAFAYTDTSTNETRVAALRKSSAIYEQVLAATKADELPNEYSLAAGNLGRGLLELGKTGKDIAMVDRAIAMLRQNADLYAGIGRPTSQASDLTQVAEGLVTSGNLRSSAAEPQEAIDLYFKAMDIYRAEGDAETADALRYSQSFAYVELGYQKSKTGDNAGAAVAYGQSLALRDREKNPDLWRFSANELGIALQNQGYKEDGVETLKKSVDAYRQALSAAPRDTRRDKWIEIQGNLISVLRNIADRTPTKDAYLALADADAALVGEKDGARERDGRDITEADRVWALSRAAEVGNDFALMQQAIEAHRKLLAATDLADTDRIYPTLQLIRSLFVGANLGGGDAMRREAIAATDASWPLIERGGTLDRKVGALLDRANLMAAIAASEPSAYAPADIEAAFQRAIALADPARDAAVWRNALTQLASYQLSGMENPDFPLDRMNSGIITLRTMVDATPRQAEPQAWGEAANWYGYALSLRGKRETTTASFEAAVPVLRDALTAFEISNNPVSAAHTRDSLCGALVGLGRLQKQRAVIQEGIENCASAEAYMREHQMASVLPIVEANLADARKALAELGSTPE